MKNMMKEYLGNNYSNNHLRNFCLYWQKAAGGRGDEWRKDNDLDCLYFDGDLRADTLMSAWTPIKWVADCLNSEYDIKFYKKRKDSDDPSRDLKLLAENRDTYLSPKHELVQLLDRFLELAELRCNFILLPDRKMNPARYKTYVTGKEIWFFDEVPATLYHIFKKETLGRYFDDENEAAAWVRREKLEMGFYEGRLEKEYVIPLIHDLHPSKAKWLTEEGEIKEALTYMVELLKNRNEVVD